MLVSEAMLSMAGAAEDFGFTHSVVVGVVLPHVLRMLEAAMGAGWSNMEVGTQ